MPKGSEAARLITAAPWCAVRSKPTHEKQYDEDDQDYANDTDAAVPEAVAVTAEAATEAAKQEDDEDDYQYESERHNLFPLFAAAS